MISISVPRSSRWNCEAVAQRVQRHVLLDPAVFAASWKKAVELGAGRHRLAEPLAGNSQCSSRGVPAS